MDSVTEANVRDHFSLQLVSTTDFNAGEFILAFFKAIPGRLCILDLLEFDDFVEKQNHILWWGISMTTHDSETVIILLMETSPKSLPLTEEEICDIMCTQNDKIQPTNTKHVSTNQWEEIIIDSLNMHQINVSTEKYIVQDNAISVMMKVEFNTKSSTLCHPGRSFVCNIRKRVDHMKLTMTELILLCEPHSDRQEISLLLTIDKELDFNEDTNQQLPHQKQQERETRIASLLKYGGLWMFMWILLLGYYYS